MIIWKNRYHFILSMQTHLRVVWYSSAAKFSLLTSASSRFGPNRMRYMFEAPVPVKIIKHLVSTKHTTLVNITRSTSTGWRDKELAALEERRRSVT